MTPKILLDLKSLLQRGLEDDGFALDWTTLGVTSAKTKSRKARIVAKADGIFFGETAGRAAELLSTEIGFSFSVKTKVADGTRVKAGTVVAEWKGDADGILAIERPYLNLTCYLSGIATRTRSLVSIVDQEWKKSKHAGTSPRVTSTRKILPYYRDAAISAVMAGGGVAHRVSLAGGVLIKENHIEAAGGIAKAIAGVRKVAPHLLKIEIEVKDIPELREALAAEAEVILFDNFRPSEVKEALKVVSASKSNPLIECSGGISEPTIADYAIPGVHLLSIGGLTHSVTALDLSLLME